jgi:hypothetical protein
LQDLDYLTLTEVYYVGIPTVTVQNRIRLRLYGCP